MKKLKIQFSLTFVVLPILLLIAMSIYLVNMSKSFENESMQTLEEISAQSVNAVQAEIYNKMYLVQDLAMTIDIDYTAGDEEIARSVKEQLGVVVKNHGLYSMGIITSDGKVYDTSGSVTSTSELTYLNDLSLTSTGISGRILADEKNKIYVNVYCTPILNKDTYLSEATLFAAFENSRFRQMIEITSYQGNGYSYLVDNNGDIVVDSNNPNAFDDLENIYSSMEAADSSNKNAIERLEKNIRKSTTGYVTYYNRGVKKYLYCAPVGINDWYMLTVVPVAVVNERLYKVVTSTVIFAVVVIIVYIALVMFNARLQRKRQEELASMVYVDELTGGKTFAKFQLDYESIMKEYSENKFAVVSMDLNRFKMLNDMYGYDEGDKIIRLMNELWEEQLSPMELCGHRSADRFVILLAYEDRKELKARLENYVKQLQDRVEGKYKLNAAIGVYEVGYSEESFEVIFNRSIMAFSTAKNRSKMIEFYDAAMEEGLVWERFVEDYFQKAIENHEFKVYYQAKVNAETGKVSGAEALVRWIRPDGSVVFPGKFIPVLENNGMIAELDRYMFREVLSHQKQWMDAGIPIVPVSVNLSRVQLSEQNFVERYKDMLEEVDLPSKYIGLEFTESAMFDNEDVLRSTVDQLHSLGIKVLIDDFGVGYSSMMTLKAIPVDIMKMDKSFVDSIGDERGNKIVVGLIEFALSLGMTVTAEGVEDENQYMFLREHNCSDIQGYYFARPIPAEEYCEKFLKTA